MYGPPCLYPDSVIGKYYLTMTYMVCQWERVTQHDQPPPPLVQHRLAKLDVFKGEIGEKLDIFIFQVEELDGPDGDV